MDLSIIIAACDEGQGFLEETVSSIKSALSVDAEIILVDDGSAKPIEPIEGVKVIRQKNKGVGQAFRTGIDVAQSDNIFLQGADIRLTKNGWDTKMLKEIKDHPKALTCTACVGLNTLNERNMDINIRRNVSRRTAATVLIFHDKRSHPKKDPTFRNIVEAQWIKPVQGKESVEVPCILGAAYGASKEWLQYIDIWNSHRSWGSLEPYASLQSWLFGGSCRVAPDIETGHIFNRNASSPGKARHLMFNKLLIASLLFDDYDRDRLIAFLGNAPEVGKAKEMMSSFNGEIEKKRAEFKEKTVVDIRSWCKEWEVDFRED